MPGSRQAATTTELVSIIVPTHNRFESLRRALASVGAQTHAPVEAVVVDDGSTDGTTRYLESLDARLADGATLRVIAQGRRGAAAARNRGLEACEGAYVMFLDSDDEFRPGAVSELVSALRAGDAEMVCGAWRDARVAEGRVRLGQVRSRPGVPDVVSQMLRLDGWSPDFCYLYRARVLERVRWDESLRVGQDMDFNLRVACGGARVARSDACVGYYVHHAGERVSRGPLARWIEAGLCIVERAADTLADRGELTDERREAAAESLWLLASSAATRDRSLYRRGLASARDLKSDFRPRRIHHRLAAMLLGRSAGAFALDLARRIIPPLWARRPWS